MINPELQLFLRDWTRAWSTLPAGAGPAQRRAHFETIAEAMRQPTPEGVTTEEHHVTGPERRVRVRLFRAARKGPRPALIYMHGGAWMQGSPETHWDITAGIAAATGQVVISVDYALAPEQPFPAAADDCRAVVDWAFDEAQSLGLQREAIAIGGDSAGANLAAVQTLSFRGTPRALRAQLLVYPGVVFRSTASRTARTPKAPSSPSPRCHSSMRRTAPTRMTGSTGARPPCAHPAMPDCRAPSSPSQNTTRYAMKASPMRTRCAGPAWRRISTAGRA
jgi:acetyl esterase